MGALSIEKINETKRDLEKTMQLNNPLGWLRKKIEKLLSEMLEDILQKPIIYQDLVGLSMTMQDYSTYEQKKELPQVGTRVLCMYNV